MSETVDRILDQAERDMRLSGFHAVSFRDLADALGIKSASVHYHFPKKEDLGLALVKRYAERFFEGLEAKAKSAEDPKAALEALISMYRSALFDHDRICLCGMLGAESPGLPETISAQVADFFKDNISWLSHRLHKSQSEAERITTATGIVSTLQGGMMMANSLGDYDLFERAAKSISTV